MRRLFATAVFAAGVTSLLAAVIADAQAQSRRQNGPRELIIRQRSFTDNGNVPPVQSLQRYVTTITEHRLPPYWHNRGIFGGETLPGRFGAAWPN